MINPALAIIATCLALICFLQRIMIRKLRRLVKSLLKKSNVIVTKDMESIDKILEKMLEKAIEEINNKEKERK